LGSGFGLLVCESVLRWRGLPAWEAFGVDAKEPTFNEPDPQLGWKLKEGHYQIPPYSGDGKPIALTILLGGRRITSPTSCGESKKPKVIAAGCSYTFGWAVSDEETYPWQLQKHWTDREILNYGTGGYSTYQTLLLLEKILPAIKPEKVIYGLADFQEVRNVAPASWMSILARFSKRGHVDIPYVTLDSKGGLCRHQPERYQPWPGAQRWVTIHQLQWVTLNALTFQRRLQQTEATRRLLVEMDQLCKANGAELTVAVLYLDRAEKKEEYLSFLASKGIRALDCVALLTPDNVVINEGHPNGKVHDYWAERIAKARAEVWAK